MNESLIHKKVTSNVEIETCMSVAEMSQNRSFSLN